MRVFRLTGTVVSTLLVAMTHHAIAQSNEDYRITYESAKPQPGGITLSTRGEFATCWMAWSKWGEVIIAAGPAVAEIHADWTVALADAHFQHWWKRAEDAYGVDRQDDMIEKAQGMSDRFGQAEHLMEALEWAGTCYVPEAQRLSFAQARPLSEYLEGAKAPSQSAAPETSTEPQRPTGTIWVYGEARGSSRNYTCNKYFDRTDATAKSNAKANCRSQGGQPGATAFIDDSGYDVYKSAADQCYEARAKVECTF